ncbi:30S ribosomal protein S8 [Candidatus Microgenomates bacterium]|nr:30S ribosomal protein S8 [Candidatus Microgenomates bacterium]
MDQISNFFIRIKNAALAGHDSATVPYSRFKESISKALVASGYLIEAKKQDNKLVLTLGAGRIAGLKLISKPGLRVYKAVHELKTSKGKFSMFIMSTPLGVITSRQAREKNIGGEVLAEIW